MPEQARARWWSRPRRPGRVVAAVAVAAASVLGGTRALASFVDPATATGTLSTGTLATPSNLTGSCVALAATLNWTATSSLWATGHELRWGTTSGGPYPNATTVQKDILGNFITTKVLTLAPLTTYYFVVRAYAGGWRSADSNQRTVSC